MRLAATMRTALGAAAALLLWTSSVLAAQQRAPGWIGIGFEVLSDGRAGPSVVVTEVREGSPAAGAGVEVGDRLLAINEARTAGEFERLAERLALRVGDPVDITLMRNGRRVELSLRAAERPADFALFAPKPPFPAVPSDSMVETMFRAMDSLRVQLLATVPRTPSAPGAPVALRPVSDPVGPIPVEAPFEFFVFRGEQHDSLRLEMDALNRRIEALREQEQRIARRRRQAARNETAALDAQLAELERSIEAVTLESAELRAAMAEAARVTAGFQYQIVRAPDAPPDAEPATFRPLTPYLLGSNRVAGAEVVDLRPGLSDYFGVRTGVLVVDVAEGTPAALAGIQPGDVIVRIGQTEVASVETLRAAISRAGSDTPISIVRRGSSVDVQLRRR